MSDLLLLGDATTILPLFVERTIIYACWYSALFWLPVRGIAAMIECRCGVVGADAGLCNEALADPGYRIGMDIEPPM